MSDLWKELHTHAINYTGTNDAIYLAGFGRRIPRYTKGCACQEFWTNWIRANPPTYTTAMDYFTWTIKAHNAVNVKLNRPEMSLEDAIKLYKPEI
jgi:hypothetical protein